MPSNSYTRNWQINYPFEFKPKSVIRLYGGFRAAVRQIDFCLCRRCSGLHREKAGSKMPAAVRKATKEPTKAHCRQPNLVWRSNDRFGLNSHSKVTQKPFIKKMRPDFLLKTDLAYFILPATKRAIILSVQPSRLPYRHGFYFSSQDKRQRKSALRKLFFAK